MNRRTLFIIIAAMLACLLTAGTTMAKGKKYALFVGINDYMYYNGLDGAVPDAEHMKSLLESKFGFTDSNDKILRDREATRANILAELKRLGALAGRGDLFVFHYSGHGTLWEDKKSLVRDETVKTELHVALDDGTRIDYPLDYYDSAICPSDSGVFTGGMPWPNFILDDELYDIFAPMAARGVNVVFISDSCHSGSIGKGSYMAGKIRLIDPLSAAKIKSFADIKTPRHQKKATGRQVAANYVVLSAAQNNEFAMDSPGRGQVGGLFTSTLVDYMTAGKITMTYKRLMELVSPKVAEVSLSTFSNPQHPQIDGRFGSTAAVLFSVPK